MEYRETKEGETTDTTQKTNAGRLLKAGITSQDKLIFENRIEREWLSTNEAAHFLSVSPNALRIMVHRGQIPVYSFGRRLRFSVRDCQALFVKKGA